MGSVPGGVGGAGPPNTSAALTRSAFEPTPGKGRAGSLVLRDGGYQQAMASLLIRTSDGAIDIDVPDLDDETLTTILVTIDDSLERRAGIWVHSQDYEDYGQPNRMLWLSADQIDIKATFDGETPPPAGALATTVRGTTSETETSATGGLFGP